MWAYLSRSLDGTDADELEGHLQVCQRCCGELEFSRQLREMVAEAGTRPMPPSVRSRIEQLAADADPGRGESA